MQKAVQKGINKYVDLLIDFWLDVCTILVLWGRPLAHCWLQKGALGTSLEPFGMSQDPSGVNLGVLGRLLVPK